MGISHENLLHSIESDFPDEIKELAEFENFQPEVREEYLIELCSDNERLRDLLDEMLEYFYRYTRDVCFQKSLMHQKDGIQDNLEEIRERDVGRRALHNSMIDSVKILARNLKETGKDTAWFDALDKKGRAGYARLALLTTFLDIKAHHGR